MKGNLSMSEAIAPAGPIQGKAGWIRWVNNKSSEASQDVVKSAGLKVPAWVVTVSGLSDVYEKLRGHLLYPVVDVYAENDEATGGAIPGTGLTQEDFDNLPDDDKRAYRKRQFAIIGVVDEKLDTITPAVFEMSSLGLQFAIGRAVENYNRPGLDTRIGLLGCRTIFTATASMGKNEKSGRPQINGSCTPQRVQADDPNGVRVLKHIASEQFKADCKACKEALDRKVSVILHGEGSQQEE